LVNFVRGQFPSSSRVLALLIAATWVVACGLNPQPEPPLEAPTPPIAATGGSSGEGGTAGTANGGVVASPDLGGAGGATGASAQEMGGVGGMSPTAGPGTAGMNDFAARDGGFAEDSGSFDPAGGEANQ
jgi:hypothetical protein